MAQIRLAFEPELLTNSNVDMRDSLGILTGWRPAHVRTADAPLLPPPSSPRSRASVHGDLARQGPARARV